MRKFLIVVGIIVGLAMLVAIGSWFGTGGARQQADRLFAAVRANDVPAVEALMSPELRAKVKPEKFMHIARTWGLGEATDVTWRKWGTGTDGAKLNGSFSHPDGTSQELAMHFIDHEGAWKLVGIETEFPGLITDPTALAVPDAKTLEAMIGQVTRDFGRSVRERDFSVLHASMAGGSRAANTVEELKETFGAFVSGGVDVSPAAELAPLLHAPAGIDPEGRLVVEGHYPSIPVHTHFNYSFLHEKGAWRLASIKVETVAPESTATATTE